MRILLFFFSFSFLFSVSQLLSQSFEEVAQASGISHYHFSSNYMGGGVAFFDYNNDGYDDIYLTGGTNSDKLYKNLGNGQFEDITNSAGISASQTSNSRGVVTGDIDNDGFRDLFLARQGMPNKLFHNNGDGTFTDISISSGIDAFSAFSMGASMGDVNLDGFLDIYVINYIKKLNSDNDGFYHECFADWVFINNGDNTFTEVSEVLEIEEEGCGLAVSFTDYNQDDKPDIYIANDFGEWLKPNRMYQNQYDGDSKLLEVGDATQTNAQLYGMGIAVGDYDKDGYFDYYVTNLGNNRLLKGNSIHVYEDKATEAGVLSGTVNELNSTGWGTVFFDYDNDGYEDLFVSNGYVPAIQLIATTPKDPNRLFKNNGTGGFDDVSEEMMLADSGFSRGMAIADFDRDGDMDILVTILEDKSSTSTKNTKLYQNSASAGNHLQVKLIGTSSNRDGFGAKLKAYKDGELWLREMSGGASHVSQHSSWAHFGMNTQTNFDSLEIIWVGGKRQQFYDIPANKSIIITEDDSNYKIQVCETGTCTEYENSIEKPFNLTAVFEESLGRVSLNWGFSGTNATSFVVERKLETGEYDTIATLPITQFNYDDFQFTVNKSYTYRVYTTNPALDSEYSDFSMVSTTISPLPTPEKPTGQFNAEEMEITLEWSYSDSRADSFWLAKKVGELDFEKIASFSNTKTNFTDSNIDSNQVYSYKVLAKNNLQQSAYSDTAQFFTEVITGLENSALSKSLSLFPNPFEGVCFLQLPTSSKNLIVEKIEAFGIDGKKLALEVEKVANGNWKLRFGNTETKSMILLVHTNEGMAVKRVLRK
jgi:hypothetical protein